MMNFLYLVLNVLAAKLAFAAIISQKNEGKAAVTDENASNLIIDAFPGELWVEIGSFLPFPQQELGYLNKTTSAAVFKLYPYRNFVARRYEIHELFKFNNDKDMDKDMAWFKSLILVKNPVEIFRSISSGFLGQRAFPNSKGPISRYMVRYFFKLSADEIIALNLSLLIL